MLVGRVCLHLQLWLRTFFFSERVTYCLQLLIYERVWRYILSGCQKRKQSITRKKMWRIFIEFTPYYFQQNMLKGVECFTIPLFLQHDHLKELKFCCSSAAFSQSITQKSIPNKVFPCTRENASIFYFDPSLLNSLILIHIFSLMFSPFFILSTQFIVINCLIILEKGVCCA